jgi:hypothetical protein
MADQVEKLPAGARLMVLGPVVRGRKGEYTSLLDDLRKSGFVRVRVDKQIYTLDETIPLEKNKKHDIEVVVDRLVLGTDQRTRLVDSLETGAPGPGLGPACARGRGRRKAHEPELLLRLRRDQRSGAGAAQLLLQHPARRLPDLHGARYPAGG